MPRGYFWSLGLTKKKLDGLLPDESKKTKLFTFVLIYLIFFLTISSPSPSFFDYYSLC